VDSSASGVPIPKKLMRKLRTGMSHDYVWPLSNSATPDKMNTSFGPRIKEDRWDFHDGIDLPAPGGTDVHAMRAGMVHHAGPRGSGGYSSRRNVEIPCS
jgi:murein DD-endopeptidase MepM/ murein hydrolase activator NlpD